VKVTVGAALWGVSTVKVTVGAALWGASSVKVTVGRGVVGGEHGVGSGCGALRCGV